MIQVACQHCHTQFSVAGDASADYLPHCHRPLPADDADGPPIDAAEDDAWSRTCARRSGLREGSDDLDARTVVHAPLSGRRPGPRHRPGDARGPARRLPDPQRDRPRRHGHRLSRPARSRSPRGRAQILPGYARAGRAPRCSASAPKRRPPPGCTTRTSFPSTRRASTADTYFYAMELIDGASLDAVIHSRPDLLSTARHARGLFVRLGGSRPAPPAARPGPRPAAEAVDTGHRHASAARARSPTSGTAPPCWRAWRMRWRRRTMRA
jgi:hypothetical protein